MKSIILNQLLILYSTSNCHLCEQAEAILAELSIHSFSIIDIVDDEQLLLSYGLRIPVLQRQDTKTELNWPFDTEDIALFLR